ncbi:VanW family protein [Ruania albidiflava]|uniref:VanW family protein n=1 Tax=Ruania albidiflava TaxID=366586 RepID=UPI0003B5EDB1|nr:VanW family protein [Ruania albidiflava]
MRGEQTPGSEESQGGQPDEDVTATSSWGLRSEHAEPHPEANAEAGPDQGETPETSEDSTQVIPAAGTDEANEPTTDEDSVTPKKRRRGARAVIWAAVVLVVLAGGYVAGAWFLGDRVPGETSVAGVDLSGLPVDEAERVLTEGLADQTTEPIEVTFDDSTTEIDPAEAGLQLDAEATVASFTGFTLDPNVVLGHLFGLGDRDPISTVDEDQLHSTLEELSEQLAVAPTEGVIEFVDGEPKVTDPEDGAELDVPAAGELLTEEWITGERPLPLPSTAVSPEIDQEQIDAAMSDQVEPMMSGPVTLKVNDTEAELSPAEMVSAATMPVEGDHLNLTLDGERLAELVGEKVSSIGETPQDARIVLRDGEPHIIPAVTGTGLDPDELAQAVREAAVDPDERTATVELAETEPDFSTQDAEDLGITEVIGSYETPYPYNPQRTTNLEAGTAHINGTLVMPGDRFSLLDALRPISTANGYVASGVVENGFESNAVGGGLSQVSTTTFNAAFEAGLADVTHQPHSRYFSRYPEGREATLWDPSIDMVFENNTGHGVLIQAYVTDSNVVVKMWGTDVFDVSISTGDRYDFTSPRTVYNTSPQCIPEGGGESGFTVQVTRTVKKGGEVVEQRTYTHAYSPWNRVVCGSPPSDNDDD